MRSGNVNLANTAGTFRNAGNIGYEWSSRTSPSSNTLAYWFEFNATESRPSWGPNNRYNGLPLRWFLPRWGADLLICIPPLTSLIQYSGSGGGKRTNGYLDRLKKKRHQDYYQNNMRR